MPAQATAGRPAVRIRDLAYGQRFLVVVSGRKVLVEVVFVRPRRRFGDRRIVLRRVDTRQVLARTRSLDELLPTQPS